MSPNADQALIGKSYPGSGEPRQARRQTLASANPDARLGPIMQLPNFPLVIERRVDFADTDAAGLIHFTTYFRFMEAAEATLFRELGLPMLWTDEGGSYGFPRVDCQCRFRRPVTFDDLVRIEMRIDTIDANRIHYAFTFHGPGDVRCATGTMVTASVCRDASGALSSVPLPDSHLEKLMEWKNRAG